MDDLGLKPIELLNAKHDRSAFDCGSEPLNQYLKLYALQNQKRDVVRNYVTCDQNDEVKGFYWPTVLFHRAICRVM